MDKSILFTCKKYFLSFHVVHAIFSVPSVWQLPLAQLSCPTRPPRRGVWRPVFGSAATPVSCEPTVVATSPYCSSAGGFAVRLVEAFTKSYTSAAKLELLQWRDAAPNARLDLQQDLSEC